ncbi:MAG: uroporphyrinogen decarboxylase family protein [Planctomycetota bacterium]|jgi:uroporphyrinogen decarboxylase
MTGKERIAKILKREPVDRIGLFEHFWGDTHEKWVAKGWIPEDADFGEHFGFDMASCWCFNNVAKLDFEPEVIEEDEETILVRDGNGALLRNHKLHASTPEHVDFLVKDRAGWEEHIKPFLKAEKARINFESYREAKARAEKNEQFFCWAGINVFEQMHPVCGHEYMLMGMAMNPEWIEEMVETYSQLNCDLMDILFEEEGEPDGIWYYEDMGFKERPFMSPDMYKELIQPGHIKTCNHAHKRNLPVIMHSCGFIEPLLPGMVEAGIDCLQVIEIKAGMDLLKCKEEFGDRIAFCGGIDARKLVANDIEAIKEELETKIPEVMKGSGYILHSDHSIPDTCNYDTYKYFIEEGLKIGTY